MSTKIEVNNCFVLLYGFSTKSENFLLSLLLLKSCSTFYLWTFSQVLSTVIEIFLLSILHFEMYINSMNVEW